MEQTCFQTKVFFSICVTFRSFSKDEYLIHFSSSEGTSFGLEGLFRMEDFIVVAYSSQNKEVIELLKKVRFIRFIQSL